MIDAEGAAPEPGPLWTVHVGGGPVVATAIHDGHELRPDVRRLIRLSDAERLREEDPYTASWTSLAPTRVVVHRSRFEVDLNRPRDGSVYRTPAECWGLDLWHEPPTQEVLERSYAEYDAFYAHVRELLDRVQRAHGRFVVYDLHSYNHRRSAAGPEVPPDDPEANPEINLGTGSLDRDRWGGVADAFLASMRAQRVAGRPLDVRENVRFQGGWFSAWIHRTYPETGVALAIEVKKTFMDEWTGAPDPVRTEEVGRALAGTVPAVRDALGVPARAPRPTGAARA
jgi:N-formylglutamate amidohydrolase